MTAELAEQCGAELARAWSAPWVVAVDIVNGITGYRGAVREIFVDSYRLSW